jgi:hypothetical protein
VTQPVTGGPASASPALNTDRSVLIRRSIGILGVLASLSFILFDFRSRSLTSRSEKVLEYLEREVLFPDNYGTSTGGTGMQLGLLRLPKETRWWQKAQRMNWWVRGLEIAVGVGFFLSIFL